MSAPAGAKTLLEKYWWEGFNTGLLMLDGILLLLCAVDVMRFQAMELSLKSAAWVAWEAALQGNSLLLSLVVFAFFMLALPSLWAILAALLESKAPLTEQQMKMFNLPEEDGPRVVHYLFRHGQGRFALHLFISIFMAAFTAVAMAMEVLSGFSRDGDGHSSYYFMSWWLVIVFLGQPVWAVYVSPIIRKLIVRTADRGKAHPGEIIREVVTEPEAR